jgi:predicted  nucleic acid-binding Zn-ribbon protein
MFQINKEQINILVELQKVDTESDRIRSILACLPDRIEALDARLKEYENELSQKEDTFSDIKKEYRTGESDVQMNISKIKEKDIKLMSVKDNKEYQALLREIDTLKIKNSEIEDRLLEHLEYIDSEESLISEKRDEFDQLKKDIEKEKSTIEEERELEEKKLSELNSEREAIFKKLNPDLAQNFLDVRKRTGIVAVAAVNASVCQGCHMNIPPQMFNELQRCDTLKLCPHCHRIIYWNENQKEG